MLYGLKGGCYDNATHVQVRVLCPEELPVDLATGLKYIESRGANDDDDFDNIQTPVGRGGFLSWFCCVPPR